MSNDDWYLIVDDDDDERVVLESSSCYQSQSQMDQNLQLPLKRNHTTTSAFDDKILMPPPAAIVKRARVDDEDIVDLISESDSDCSESISIIIEDAIQVSVTSSTNRNQIGKENNMNSSNTSIMSLAQRLHAKTIALGPSQQHPTNLNLSNQLPMTSTPSVAKSSSNSSSSSSSSSSYVPPSNATQRQHMNTMLDRSESIYAGDVGMRSAPNSQTSVASSHNSSNNSKIVFNSFCPSHDPSKHGGRAIVDMTDDIEIPTSQPLTQQHSQSQLQQEELTSMSLGEESMHRVLTAEQLQSWVVVLLVDQREKEHAFQQAKLLGWGLQCVVKTLSLGDYLWVARPPDEPQYPVGSAAAAAQQGQWIVLDCIAERKTFSDLLSSIRDKRYIEQKMRLIDCGLPTCLYIVETSSTNSHHQNFAPTTMISAIVSTAIESGLHVLKTRGLDHTASTLRANHLKVAARFKSGRCGTKFMTLEMFQKRTVKKHVETVGDLFSHALRQIPMCGTPSAQALVNRFGTMARLMKYLEETDSRTAQKEISMLQKVGVLQRVGPKLAQTIWSLFAEYF